MPAPTTSSRHLYTGHQPGHIQAAPRPRPTKREPLSRDHPQAPVSNATVISFDASAVVHTCSSSRRTPTARSPPRLFTDAACGGLRSPPARRPRRTYLHHWHSTVRAGDLLHRLHSPFRTHEGAEKSSAMVGQPSVSWLVTTSASVRRIVRANGKRPFDPLRSPVGSGSAQPARNNALNAILNGQQVEVSTPSLNVGNSPGRQGSPRHVARSQGADLGPCGTVPEPLGWALRSAVVLAQVAAPGPPAALQTPTRRFTARAGSRGRGCEAAGRPRAAAPDTGEPALAPPRGTAELLPLRSTALPPRSVSPRRRRAHEAMTSQAPTGFEAPGPPGRMLPSRGEGVADVEFSVTVHRGLHCPPRRPRASCVRLLSTTVEIDPFHRLKMTPVPGPPSRCVIGKLQGLTSSLSRSVMATGSSQCGQGPPRPTRRMKARSPQRCSRPTWCRRRRTRRR